jgi:hypothetical protein
MPTLPFLIFNAIADLAVFAFISWYFFSLQAKQKELDKREGKLDTDYHQIVDNALTKERKILEDATAEADQIIAGAKVVSKTVKDEVNNALQIMVVDIQKEVMDTAKNFTTEYQLSLKQLANQSVADFAAIVKTLQADLNQQIQQFHSVLLPNLEHELANYKQARLAQTDAAVTAIVLKASQTILNKAISLEDHKQLVFDCLEKAKQEAVFD